MTPSNIKKAVALLKALEAVPEVRQALKSSPKRPIDGIMLELSAAEMEGGEGQGSTAYLYLPPDMGPEILDLVESLLGYRLKAIGVNLP